MQATRFDTIAKLFADRKLSRRNALARAGAGLATGALAAAGLGGAARVQAGDQAAPAAGGDHPVFLFLQAFRAGSVAPKEDAEGRYVLTLEQGLGHTVYFSDRPDRIVGAAPTPQFLAGLGFPDDNPPNAALVVETEAGATEVAVVELFSPEYDEATHTATYEVAVLAEWERSTETGFSEAPADMAAMGSNFGAAHLFIDDCPHGQISCLDSTGNQIGYGIAAGFCYDWGDACCRACDVSGQGPTAYCNAVFGTQGCKGTCTSQSSVDWFGCPS